MRNAMILLGLWVGIVLTAYTLVYWNGDTVSPAQLAQLERLAERTYVDSEGRFQVELPPGWRAEQVDLGVHLSDPMDKIEVWVLAIDDLGAVRAIVIGWENADPCFEKAFDAFEELPADGPRQRKVKITYRPADEDLFAYGVARVSLSGAIVTLARGDRAVCERRCDELDQIEESVNVPPSS
jgi:hypothetical protein